ncbi:hypothetical protein BOX15_Mlig009079g1 [Macrostomum lignano]|uniref:Uncharacterized protein n=2 Tax=Macrostomum lignano TaxID=282301 RepID=A0A267FNX6_9PLAT|nr:hypothetical protein BOX15_Mlig009079g2 [Macrostomum lignano]PAA89228.1 hypothetical protein BOX15_Mlig009079g1 [Macrostomum lignano]
MSKYRGFTVSFNAIGAGKSTRKYLLLAVSELLTPLLLPANKNMIEAKCSCQLVMNTRSLYRRGAGDTWIKYQLLMVVAPTRAKHAQAKRLIEGILPGSVNLEEYRDTAKARLQCNEFVPDNKPLVYGYQRVGITHHQYGEVYDLKSPTEPLRDRETGRILYAPWHMTKRERRGIFLSTKNFPLQRKLNIIGLLDMLLLGVGAREDGENQSNVAREGGVRDAFGKPRQPLGPRQSRSGSASAKLDKESKAPIQLRRISAAAPTVRMSSVSFGLQ